MVDRNDDTKLLAVMKNGTGSDYYIQYSLKKKKKIYICIYLEFKYTANLHY